MLSRTQVNNPGYYLYSLNIETDAGCVFLNVVSDSIFIADKPKVNFTVNRQFALLDDARFSFTNRTDGAVMNEWQFGDGNTSDTRSPVHIFGDTGLFEVQLWVQNSFGCSDSAADTVRVRPMLECFIPNAITPNYDRLNETFGPVCEGLMDFEMRIYNRWGQEVFVTTNSEQWNPYANPDDNFQSGIYMYAIKARDYLGDPKFFSGSFILIR